MQCPRFTPSKQDTEFMVVYTNRSVALQIILSGVSVKINRQVSRNGRWHTRFGNDKDVGLSSSTNLFQWRDPSGRRPLPSLSAARLLLLTKPTGQKFGVGSVVGIILLIQWQVQRTGKPGHDTI